MYFARRVLPLIFLMLATRAAMADEPLVWKFTSGDEHHYRMTQLVDMQMKLSETGPNLDTGAEQLIDLTWKVEAVDEQGHAKIRQTVDRTRMKMQAPGQPTLKYDSDSEDDPAGFAAMLTPLYRAMIEHAFSMTMSPRGEITNVEIPEQLSLAMKNVPGIDKKDEMFSSDGFKTLVQNNSLVLPKPADLSPGYQWSKNTSMESKQFGSSAFTMTYRYLGPYEVKGKEIEAFSVSMKMEFGKTIAGVELEILDQKSAGEILFDREAGRLESSKLQQDVELQVTVAGQPMNQKLTQKFTFERIAKP